MNSYIKLVIALSIVVDISSALSDMDVSKFVSDTENFNALNQQEDPNSDLTDYSRSQNRRIGLF